MLSENIIITFNFLLINTKNSLQLQYALMKLAPLPIRTFMGHQLFKRLRIEALEQKQKKLKLI